MGQIYIKDFVGVYHRNGNSPNHFVSTDTGYEIIIKTKISTTNSMPPNYLLFKPKDAQKFEYFTSLWRKKDGIYKISDTQKPTGYGVCTIDLFTIEIIAL